MKEYKEPKALNDVSQFHEIFDLPVLPSPEIPSEKRCALRVNLLEEELGELKEAIAQRDMTEIADALCDIQYVLSGAILEFGLADRFAELFAEVQRSNMSKTCKSLKQAELTQVHYTDKDGTESKIVQRGDEYIVYRIPDGKVLKSVEYSPADLSRILKANT